MATTIGPLFAIKAFVPAGWAPQRAADDRDLILCSEKTGMAFKCTVVSKNLLNTLKNHSETWVFIAQVIKEDGESLFAFESWVERELFSELREIDSIGSKFAATAVAELGVRGLSMMLTSPSMPAIKITGLGPKTLEKIKAGIKERSDAFSVLFKQAQLSGAGASASGDLTSQNATTSALPVDALAGLPSTAEIPNILLQALSQLGLKSQDIFAVYDESVKLQPKFLGLTTGEQVKLLLATWNQMKKSQNKEFKGVTL